MPASPGPGTIVVLDFGKTNAKISVVDVGGRVIESVAAPNVSLPGPPWRRHDLAGLGDWVLASLAALARRHPLAHLIPTGHGSGGVLVLEDPDAGGDGAALPMMDYEDAMPPEIDADYRARTGSFLDRGSAIMFASAHAARQLWRMRVERPDAVARARWYLNVAQYWAWRLSGVAASEVSAMGAQSQLWNVVERRWSPIVMAEGWERLMPPFASAWAALGPVRPALARRHGLPEGLLVHVGAHDSSANLHRYQAAGLSDFTLVSTGTWIVAMSDASPLERLDEARGMTLNADVAGRPVGGALTMGGREFALIAGSEGLAARAEAATVAALVARGTMALPSFCENDGQFPGSAGRGRIIGPQPAHGAERRALAVLQAALLTVACADALGGARLVLDGTFLGEPLYAPLVAALRPGRPTETSGEPVGVAAGAALLVGREVRRGPVPAPLAAAAPFAPPGLAEYAARWRAGAEMWEGEKA
jgi:sugar (pentulose or hexulose) kinase